MNTEGISIFGSLIDLAVQHGLITKAGAFFKVDGQNIQGREGTKKYLKENQKLTKELKDQIWKKVKENTQPTKLERPTDAPVEE
jgi:recombination protein RecA